MPHVTPLVGADVERSASIRLFTGGEEETAFENGRDNEAIALAKFAVDDFLLTCVCSGEVE